MNLSNKSAGFSVKNPTKQPYLVILTLVEAICGGESRYYCYKESDSIVRRIGKLLMKLSILTPDFLLVINWLLHGGDINEYL